MFTTLVHISIANGYVILLPKNKQLEVHVFQIDRLASLKSLNYSFQKDLGLISIDIVLVMLEQTA